MCPFLCVFLSIRIILEQLHSKTYPKKKGSNIQTNRQKNTALTHSNARDLCNDNVLFMGPAGHDRARSSQEDKMTSPCGAPGSQSYTRTQLYYTVPTATAVCSEHGRHGDRSARIKSDNLWVRRVLSGQANAWSGRTARHEVSVKHVLHKMVPPFWLFSLTLFFLSLPLSPFEFFAQGTVRELSPALVAAELKLGLRIKNEISTALASGCWIPTTHPTPACWKTAFPGVLFFGKWIHFECWSSTSIAGSVWVCVCARFLLCPIGCSVSQKCQSSVRFLRF